MSSLDYLDLCRLCLVKDRVSVPIFEGEGDVRQIFLKIAACLPVKLTREDKLPKKICDDCVYKVELFYQFWNTTANAEKQLLQWLGEVSLEDKQGYVTNVLNPSVMKQEQSTENRLDGNVMQQVEEHQNNMGMGMMDNMGLGIPMIISSANQQQITSVPMDTSSNSVQTIQAVPGPSSQTTHNQIPQNQTSSTQQEDEEESSEDEENSDEECDGDEGLPVKEESEEDPSNRTIEPTTFVNVSLACDEAGPSGLQQQKISDMPEMPIPQPADGDPKSGILNGDGRFIYGKESIPMQPWQIVDVEGCLYYAFLPTNQTPKLAERERTVAKSADDSPRNSEGEETFVIPAEDETGDSDLCPIKIKKEDIDDVSSSNEDNYDDAKGYACEECNICFPVMQMLKRHRNAVHEQAQRYKCKVCFKICRSLVAFKMHVALEHKTEEEEVKDSESLTYACNYCNYESTNKSTLHSHISRKHSTKRIGRRKSSYRYTSEPEEYSCDVCEFKCQNRRRLKEHLERKHASEYKYDCEYCGKKFKVKGDMRLHVRFKHKEGPIVCDVCGKTCSNSNSLYVHQKWAHFKPKYECEICKRRMVTQENLDQHILLQHERRESFVCEECGKSFTENHRLKQHMMTHTGDRPYDCHICGKAFARRTAYRQHLLIHTGKRPYICDICGKTFTQKPGLICHRKSHPGVHPPLPVVHIEHILSDFMKKENGQIRFNPISRRDITGNIEEMKRETRSAEKAECKILPTCDICQKQFKKKYLLRRHKKLAHCENEDKRDVSSKGNTLVELGSQKQEALSCTICEFRCNKRSTMIAHLAQNHEGSGKSKFTCKRKFTCIICGLICSRKETLRSHFVRKHTQHYEFSCEQCGKEFKIKGDLTTHMRLNHREPPVMCDVCGKTCRNSHSLYTHQKHAHYKAKYECPVCHRRLVTKENLDQHVLTQHEKKEKSVCEECGKTFFENHDFRKHMRIHTGDKPYSCSVCARAFTTHSSLSQHLLLHTGERIYVCDVCGKSFAQKAGLICHRKIHSGTLPPLPVMHIDHILKEFMKKFELDTLNSRGIFIYDKESVVMKKWQILEFDGKPYYAFVPEGDTPLAEEDIPEQVDEAGNEEEKQDLVKVECLYDEEELQYDSTDEKLYEEDDLLNRSGELKEEDDVKPIILNGGIEGVENEKAIGDLYQVKVQGSMVTIEKLTSSDVEEAKEVVEYQQEEQEEEQEAYNDQEQVLEQVEQVEQGDQDQIEQIEYLEEEMLESANNHVTPTKTRRKVSRGAGSALKCKVCSEMFSSAISFRKHVAWTHKKKVCIQEDGAYICAVCDYRTLKKSLFAAHLERKHETWSRKRPNNMLFPCAACGFVCRSKHSLQSHFIRKHTDRYEHQCKFCPKKFKVKGDLTNHVRFHHKEKPINCDVCGKLCQNSGSLYVHQKWAHYKPKYECHICKRRMVTQENLDQHLLTQHEKREKIVCAECGKTFTKKDSFKRHMAVHTGCKPHSCLICNKPFARRSQLRQHLLIHTGKRPFVCDICGKAFTQKPGLICHRKTHPGPHPPLPVMPIADIVKEFTEGYVQEINARENEERIEEEA
ncbi:uncharacterized protein LOC122719867 [Apis laboriosa]|uniref:uncharacterized protein LOC122719867 n=2 Tax=Apis TaxID=7459 RepID=UPI001CC66D1D|nr:uncharacterized protein LOC122719867 [Apis laboriosa]